MKQTNNYSKLIGRTIVCSLYEDEQFREKIIDIYEDKSYWRGELLREYVIVTIDEKGRTYRNNSWTEELDNLLEKGKTLKISKNTYLSVED